jgi:hypothetical protein
MSLALLRFAPTLRRETWSKDPAFVPLGRLYEGYLDDNFGKRFCPFLIDRIAFGSQHSGLHEFDVGQRPAKSLGSWTPFRFQKIGCTAPQRAGRCEVPALVGAAEAYFGRL